MRTKRLVILPAGVAALGLSACTGTLKPNYYSPTQTGERLPMRVALLDDAGLHPQPYEWGSFALKIDPEFSNAVKAELSSLFQEVTLVTDPRQIKEEDLLAKVSTSFNSRNATVSLALLMPGAEEELVRSQTSSQIKGGCNSSCGAAAFLTGFTLFILSPITIPIMIDGQIEPTQTSIEETTRAALIAFGNKVRSHQGLVRMVRDSQAGRAALAAAEQTERSGNKLAALSHYARALILRPGAKADPEMDRRLLTKIEGLVPAVGALPAVPEEARRHVARSNAFMKAAASEGYDKVLAEMDEAMKVAPLWPEAAFNRGLIEETAGQYPQAIRSLSLYLRLAPNAQDAKAVQNKIYELEAMAERAGKGTAPKQHSMSQDDGQHASRVADDAQGTNP
jgi:hypothetical protein